MAILADSSVVATGRSRFTAIQKQIMRHRLFVFLVLSVAAPLMDASAQGTTDLTVFDQPWSLEYEQQMVQRMEAGVERYFDRYTDRVVEARGLHWQRNMTSSSAYSASVGPNRSRFRTIIGIVDARRPVFIERFGRGTDESLVADASNYTIEQVRWPVLHGVWGEGLLISPKGAVRARVVALPDADQTPEDIAGLSGKSDWALRLAGSGIQTLVPVLLNRSDTFSGSENVAPWRFYFGDDDLQTRRTNLTHREWIYRQAYVNGRHIIGLEVQKIQSGIDWFRGQGTQPVGVAGYGEGGLLALYAAAVDERIDAALVSGYFGPRENLSTEPVYRNVWGLLTEFGDAEIASLVAPRSLVIEYSETPSLQYTDTPEPDGPLPEYEDAGLRGEVRTPPFEEVASEYRRLERFFNEASFEPNVAFIHADGGTTGPLSDAALRSFVVGLGVNALAGPAATPTDRREHLDPAARQGEQVRELQDFFHAMVDTLDRNRYAFLEGDYSSAQAWDASMKPHRDYFRQEIIGVVDEDLLPLNPRLRQVYDEEDWVGYEVVLDVWPDVFAWGVLALPKDLEPGEKRPTVVLQHGIGGTPSTPERVDSYNNVMPKLARRGFAVFSVHAPYSFNVRKATPAKASVFSVIIPQYRQIVNWLKTHKHVDADRIGYYGKSWGGRTGLRVPTYIPEFRFAISSAYLNQWPRKVITAYYRTSYMWTSSIGVYEFNMGPTIGHAEMIMMFAPRPFMAESGYQDAVAPHEWVAYEFAKAKRVYDIIGVGDRAVLGFHIGGHEVHDDTIFPFIHKHLQWPVPAMD